MLLSKPKDILFTYEDYLLLLDEKRFEILNGNLIEMSPAPNTYHQKVAKNLFRLLDYFLIQKDAGIALFAPVDVVFDRLNVCQPDLLVVLNENLSIIKEKNIQGAPDLLVEILSPSTFAIDLEHKKRIYEQFKVEEYWILDPANKVFEIFSLQNNRYQLLSIANETGSVNSQLLNGIVLNLETIFS